MALEALFGTGPQQQATSQAQQMLQLGYGTGTNQLNTTTQSAIDALRAGTGSAVDALGNYTGQAVGALGSGTNAAIGALQSGYGQAAGTLDTSRGYWNALMPQTQGAFDQYSRLVSGDPATMKATLEGMPGFQTALDIAQQGAERAAAAGGLGASGNALLDVANISRGLEDQNYGTYANQLWQLAGLAPGIAGAQTGISQNIAGLQAQQGQGIAGLQSALGQGTAGLYSGLGSGIAGLQSGLGTGIAGAYSNLGTNEANLTQSTAAAQANTYQQLANAQTQAASNVWQAILGVAGLGVKAAFPGKNLTIPLAGGTATS